MQGAYAQDSLLRDYQFVKQQSSWLTSNNAAGLTNYKAKNIAEAEAGLSYAKGDLIDYWQAPTVLQANVRAEAFQRLSARTVVFGSISYDNFTGRDMAGSAFIDPTYKPFDIVEDSLTNKGRKHRDTYQLAGAIGVELWKGYSIGARVDYTSANYAKYKDLRHSNKFMDLKLSIGAMGHVLNQLTIGANYLYHRNTESLNFNTYGKIDKVYKSLIDYGVYGEGTRHAFGGGPTRRKPTDRMVFLKTMVVLQRIDSGSWYRLLWQEIALYHHVNQPRQRPAVISWQPAISYSIYSPTT